MTDIRRAIEDIASFIFECDAKIEDCVARMKDEELWKLIEMCNLRGRSTGIFERLRHKAEAELGFRKAHPFPIVQAAAVSS